MTGLRCSHWRPPTQPAGQPEFRLRGPPPEPEMGPSIGRPPCPDTLLPKLLQANLSRARSLLTRGPHCFRWARGERTAQLAKTAPCSPATRPTLATQPTPTGTGCPINCHSRPTCSRLWLAASCLRSAAPAKETNPARSGLQRQRHQRQPRQPFTWPARRRPPVALASQRVLLM